MVTIAEMPKYKAYKDSGFKWIGEIPLDWEISKLGACLSSVSFKNYPGLPLLSITREQGVIERNIEDQESNHNFIPDDLSGYKLIKKGQFGMNKMKAWQGSYGVSKYTGIVSPAYYIFDFAKEINPDFFNWAIRSKLYVSYFGSASDGVRIGQWDLSKTRMKGIPFILPDERQQGLIAKYLDIKTAQIDEAIAIKQQQISLLKERKQIIIQQAVTQGLDPNVPMKNSDVDWIGMIPEHWEVLANRTLFTERVESGREGLPLLSVSIHSGVSSEEVSEKDNVRGRVKIEDKTKYVLVKKGDVAFNMMRAWQGGIGAVTTEGMVSPAYIVAKPIGAIVADFFEYQYRCPKFIQQMDRYSKGITDFRKRLYWDGFKQLKTVVPPEKEQEKIIQFIQDLATKTEAADKLLNAQIEKLKEYKTTLINSAVTGKIKITPEMIGYV
ncbi:restriction endonuclease subunit S [Methylotuvimicrobium sp. KM2]|uniref:restriction endonuclease subunit S n=1 Tax=Methylotuvimicrobium sp. KM2 TaxID=3133976 RepID=UPI0031015B8D